MATTKKTTTSKAAKTTTSSINAFKAEVPLELISQAIHVYRSNSHRTPSVVKTRGQIKASTRKIWKQKGTGRARHGALSAPIFVGGGIAHGPKGVLAQPKALTKKMKNLSLTGILSLYQKDKHLTLIKLPAGKKSLKTKEAIKLFSPQVFDQSFALVYSQLTPEILRGFRNIARLTLIHVSQLNTFKVAQSQHLFITQPALDQLTTRLKPYLNRKAAKSKIKSKTK